MHTQRHTDIDTTPLNHWLPNRIWFIQSFIAHLCCLRPMRNHKIKNEKAKYYCTQNANISHFILQKKGIKFAILLLINSSPAFHPHAHTQSVCILIACYFCFHRAMTCTAKQQRTRNAYGQRKPHARTSTNAREHTHNKWNANWYLMRYTNELVINEKFHWR